MKNRILPILILAITLTSSLASAQMRGGPPRRGPMEAGPNADFANDPLANYLQLTAEQKTAWESVHKDFGTTMQPLIQKERDLDQQIHAALDSGTATATAVGTLVLSQHATRQQIRTAHEALDAKLASILTADQKVKFDAIQAARSFRRGPGGPDGPGPGMLRGPAGPPR